MNPIPPPELGSLHDVVHEQPGAYIPDLGQVGAGDDARLDPWFRLLVEQATDLIYLHAPGGDIIYANARLEEITGTPRADLLGRNILEILAPGDRLRAVARRNHYEGIPVSHRYEVEIICHDGSTVPLEVHSTPVVRDGVVVAWQGIARDIRERKRAQERMAAVYETARQVVGILGLDEVLSVIANRAAEITGAHACSLWLVGEDQEHLVEAGSAASAPHLSATRIALGSDHPAARAVREGIPVLARCDEAGTPVPGAASLVCVPLAGARGPMGALSLAYAHEHGADPEEVALLAIFASHAAAAIANARLFEAQRRKTQEAAAVGQIGMTAGALDAEAVLHLTGAYAYDLFAANLIAVLVLDGEETLRPVFIAERGRDPSDSDLTERFPLAGHPSLAAAVREGRTVLVANKRTHALTRDDERVRALGEDSGMVVPLVARDKAVGVLVIAYQGLVALADVQVRLAETLAHQAGVAMDNARMFAAVASAKREWEATFDAITDPVYIFSTEGTVLRANVAAARLAGQSAADLVGRHYRDVGSPEKDLARGDIFQECLRLRRPITREVEGSTVAGVFQVTAYPLLDDQGECGGVVEYRKDITAQREMQARLYHAARMAGVGELAAGVVHNFRNVLMGVSGTLDVVGLLLDRDDGPNQIRKHLTGAQEYVLRGNQVLQRLLDFARGMPQEVQAIRLDALIPDVVALCRTHLSSRGIRVVAELPHELPVVHADPGQLHEVLVNLVLNAMQAMGGHGTVTIAAEPGEECVHVHVSDTGCGIPPEDLERIFEPFYSRRQSGPPGTGIGLSASLRMVRGMGGDITVVSRVGSGSTFTIALPAASQPRA